MLGNFSIGGYFKEEAITLALKYLLDVLKFDKSKLYITYFEDDKITKNI
jgi:alanyl-tRNA synthetase